MSDSKKPEQKDPPKPLEKTHIHVDVIPKDENNDRQKDTARTLRQKLKDNIKKAVDQNKQGGKEKQFEAAREETKKVGRDTDSSQVKEIRVNVSGTDQDGDRERHAWTVIPKENKPATP